MVTPPFFSHSSSPSIHPSIHPSILTVASHVTHLHASTSGTQTIPPSLSGHHHHARSHFDRQQTLAQRNLLLSLSLSPSLSLLLSLLWNRWLRFQT
ncbi:hypothetical protein IE53DRAFT_197737 [Violaceomyces palustris]|uniref:Uncharacterized protein n=1 Tax=Violaceomyces palustris TaxID=1673888 RepID=A0ACD0NRK1_9BASI|nr:hypothetical protein IE53DRAFT_197737 [Violaceomyces palustris]